MAIDVTVIGGGMIVHDQILPALYHLQRQGLVGELAVCATRTTRLKQLVNPRFDAAFPGQRFTPYPDLEQPETLHFPDLYQSVVSEMPPYQLVVVATPDPLHEAMVRFALEHDQHVICAKPLVQRYEHAERLSRLAHERGLLLGVEYHKRFDRRSLEARHRYRRGELGHFRLGAGRLIEPYAYRHSNFQNWFTPDQSDPFTYVGCHYVDLVHFITGLWPIEVSVRGVEGHFPNGNEGWLWSSGQVVFDNQAVLNVQNGLGYPDDAAGSNDQGLILYGESGGNTPGPGVGTILEHDDHVRGVGHATVDAEGHGTYKQVNTDYFRLVPWMGEGLRPVGYGYDSIEALVSTVVGIEEIATQHEPAEARVKRQSFVKQVDEQGLLATAGNSSFNELVVEAARLSIAERGRPHEIRYGERPGVHPR